MEPLHSTMHHDQLQLATTSPAIVFEAVLSPLHFHGLRAHEATCTSALCGVQACHACAHLQRPAALAAAVRLLVPRCWRRRLLAAAVPLLAAATIGCWRRRRSPAAAAAAAVALAGAGHGGAGNGDDGHGGDGHGGDGEGDSAGEGEAGGTAAPQPTACFWPRGRGVLQPVATAPLFFGGTQILLAPHGRTDRG